MTTQVSEPRLIGYEILRQVTRAEASSYPSFDSRTQRAVLGTCSTRYLIPPGIDLFELGLIDTPGRFELLPVAADKRRLWDAVIHVLVTAEEADRQVGLLLRPYQALLGMIHEAEELDMSVAEWPGRDVTHPVIERLRLATIDVWKAKRRGTEPLSENELDALHARVARRVAAEIRARGLHSLLLRGAR